MTSVISHHILNKFIDCCRNLHIVVLDRTKPYDSAKALAEFTMLASEIPQECDVWIGMAISGGLTQDILEKIIQTWDTVNHLQILAKLSKDSLKFSYDSGLYINFEVSLWEQLNLARSSFLIQEKRYQEASDLIEKTFEISPSLFDTLWMKVVLNYRTGRWVDVINLTNEIESVANIKTDIKEKYVKEIITARAVASAHLGRLHFAFSLLEESDENIDETSKDAMFTRALILRQEGDEDQAKYLLEKLYSYTNDPEIQKALKNPSYQLEITSESKILGRSDPWNSASEPSQSPEEMEKKENHKKILLAEADQELDNFIGLQPVKDQVRRLRNMIAITQERQARSLTTESKSQHLVFAGPPGTGKTTIARVIAKIYCGLGVMKKENITEVNRAEIVGQHIGETEHKMNAIIDQALDGVLFIDEAYALVSTGAKNDFGLIAINTLLARMENDRDRLVVIIAGYPDDLNKFLSANEGLRSRFSRIIKFDSYTPAELIDMTIAIASRRDTIFSPEALTLVRNLCEQLENIELEDSFKIKRRALDVAGNARFVRNIIERCEEEREDRLGNTEDISSLTDEDLQMVTEQDVEKTAQVLLQNLGIEIDNV